MLQAADLRPLRTAAADYPEAERLKAGLRDLRATRTPFFLTGADLEPIFRWKLARQYGRSQRAREANTESAYKAVTAAAFTVHEADTDYEAELRLRILSSLRGIGIPVAAAILALTDPDHYCVIDFRGWRAVFHEDRHAFDVVHYNTYRHQMRHLAEELAWPVQEVDLALWEYDRRHHLRAV